MNFYMHRSEVKIKPLYFSPVLGTSEAKQLHVTRHMERQGVGVFLCQILDIVQPKLQVCETTIKIDNGRAERR